KTLVKQKESKVPRELSEDRKELIRRFVETIELKSIAHLANCNIKTNTIHNNYFKKLLPNNRSKPEHLNHVKAYIAAHALYLLPEEFEYLLSLLPDEDTKLLYMATKEEVDNKTRKPRVVNVDEDEDSTDSKKSKKKVSEKLVDGCGIV